MKASKLWPGVATAEVPADTSVDQTDARNTDSRIALGVSVLRAPATWACARRSN
jgi:hypothetical protein